MLALCILNIGFFIFFSFLVQSRLTWSSKEMNSEFLSCPRGAVLGEFYSKEGLKHEAADVFQDNLLHVGFFIYIFFTCFYHNLGLVGPEERGGSGKTHMEEGSTQNAVPKKSSKPQSRES